MIEVLACLALIGIAITLSAAMLERNETQDPILKGKSAIAAAEATRKDLSLQYALVDPYHRLLGLKPDDEKFLVREKHGRTRELPYAALQGVALTTSTKVVCQCRGQVTTIRDNQFAGSGLEPANSGPEEPVIGLDPRQKKYSTTAREVLVSMKLELRFDNDNMPRFCMQAGWGGVITHELEVAFRDMAALLVQLVERHQPVNASISPLLRMR